MIFLTQSIASTQKCKKNLKVLMKSSQSCKQMPKLASGAMRSGLQCFALMEFNPSIKLRQTHHRKQCFRLRNEFFVISTVENSAYEGRMRIERTLRYKARMSSKCAGERSRHGISTIADDIANEMWEDEPRMRIIQQSIDNDCESSKPIQPENVRMDSVYPDDFSDDKADSIAESSQTSSSVVKVFTSHSEFQHAMPWQRKSQYQTTSSGFIIQHKYMITNAHSVQDPVLVQVRRCGDDMKYEATVVCVDEECDLALIRVDDEAFWQVQGVNYDENRGAHPFAVQFGRVPKLNDSIKVLGYPIGGDSMCVTAGVVSRIETGVYTNAGVSGSELLLMQIDAAINSGNSGGPVFDLTGRCVGVAFQSMDASEGENIGYVIPLPVIYHFLKDYDMNKRSTGFPRLGIVVQPLENPCLRKYVGLHGDQKGVLINKVWKGSCAEDLLFPGDVLFSFDGVQIANDGSIAFRHDERMSFSYLISQKFNGETATVVVFRKGNRAQNEDKEKIAVNDQPQTISITMMPYKPRVPSHLHGKQPSYLIIGGLVFVKLTEPLLIDDFGEEYEYEAPLDLLNQCFDFEKRHDDDEVIILRQVLASRLTLGYEDCQNMILEKLNDTPVHNMIHLSKLIRDNKDDFLKFSLIKGAKREVVLSQENLNTLTKNICQVNNISSPHSDDILLYLERE